MALQNSLWAAIGAYLQRAGVSHLILEQSDRVGPAWRRHYDRLHLHTDNAHSALPFLPFLRDTPRYPSRLQMIDYLETFTRHFLLEPRFGQRVVTARCTDEAWEVETQDSLYTGQHLVIAAGYSREPYLPAWPGQNLYNGTLLHSSQYRNGKPFKGQKVLVVGFGNSGGEIAIDLWEHGAQPTMAVRSPVNVIPRELFGVPILTIGILQRKLPPRLADALNRPILRATVGELSSFGLRKPPHGPLSQIRQERRIPLIDVGTLKLIREGHIRVFPGIERFREDGVVFTGGAQEKFSAILLSTGYRPRVNAFLEPAGEVCDPSGAPRPAVVKLPSPGCIFAGIMSLRPECCERSPWRRGGSVLPLRESAPERRKNNWSGFSIDNEDALPVELSARARK